MTITRWFGLCLGLTMLSMPACKRETTAPAPAPGVEGARVPGTVNEPSTNEATAVPGTQGQTAEQIAQARCAREVRCGKVGAGKDYASQEACVTKIRADWRDDLNARECPGGVVQKELAECLEEIRNDDCGNPFDSLSRIAACRESDLCKAT